MRRNRVKEPLRYKGVEYNSYYQLEKELGFRKGVIRERIYRGFTLEQATDIDFKKKYGNTKKIENIKYGGVTYSSFKELADGYGVDYSNMLRKMSVGYSLEKALDKKGLLSIEFNGKVYKTKAELARDYNISPLVLIGRLNRGWTLEESLGGLVRPNTVIYEGKEYPSLRSLCVEKGISESTVMYRLDKGYTLEQSLDPDFDIKFSKNKISKLIQSKKVTIDGKEFKNLKEVAKYYGFKYTTIRSRLYRGCSIEQAIDPDFKKKYSKNRKHKKD